MSTLLEFKTRQKLIIGFSAVVIFTILFTAMTFSGFRRFDNTSSKIRNIDSLTYELTGLRADENRLRALSLELVFVSNNDRILNIKSAIKEKETDFLKKAHGIDSMLAGYPDQRALFSQTVSDINTYVRNRAIMINLLDSGKKKEALELVEGNQYSLYENIRTTSIAVETELINYRTAAYNNNERLHRGASVLIIVIGSILIFLIVFLSVWAVYILRKISDEIRTGVDVLASSSTDILSTVTEISAGAAETSTAVSETTTTIEEVRQTALVSNQKSQSLMESSQRAADSADKGKNSIKKVIDAMAKIDNQMNLISETVVRLSEQSRTIGEITSTVADIADQSNLLAVNAAIEAAKAGEHGRGFTIVAQEIRSLADQSKKATIQVKEILNEINKSVNQAVGVTEQGARTVDNGLNLVKQSGEVIDILSDNVEEAAEASIQISSSTQQQMAGMDQIVPAMENIKKASEQNTTGIKHTQTIAQNIHQLGQSLKKVIIKYNL